MNDTVVIDGSMSLVNSIGGEMQANNTIDGEAENVTRVTPASDYNALYNKPRIEGNELFGDKTYEQLGLDDITAQAIDEIIFG